MTQFSFDANFVTVVHGSSCVVNQKTLKNPLLESVLGKLIYTTELYTGELWTGELETIEL